MKAPNETVHDGFSSEDVSGESVRRERQPIHQPCTKCIEPIKPSPGDDEVSSVEVNDGEDDWVDIDDDKVSAVGKMAEEAGWESVDLASAVAKSNLTGEDEYAVEPFRSSKKKEYLHGVSFLAIPSGLIRSGTPPATALTDTIQESIKDAVPPSVTFLKFAYKAVSDILFDSRQAQGRH